MTQEDKKLLLKDLCARLPYGVICTDLIHGDSKITEIDIESGLVYCSDFDEYAKIESNCKPYLRPMSSMTEDEKREYNKLLDDCEEEDSADYNITTLVDSNLSFVIDWLNAHHFDYRGLIPKGLALEATDGMYDFSKKIVSK